MSDDDTKPRAKGPRNRVCTPKQRAQRRAAAVKTGARAQTALRRSVPPCKRNRCLAGYPCAIKTGVEAEGGGMEVCLPRLATDPGVQIS